jgi:hypothetical protein
MTEIILAIAVCGSVVLALLVNTIALLGWLRGKLSM